MAEESILQISTNADVCVVTFKQPSLGGVLQVESISSELRSLVQDQKPASLVIDFTDVVFFSSQMLGLLVDLWRRMKDAGGKMIISGINPQLTRVFRITRLDKIFEFYDNTQAAVSHLHA